jgi:hypothetical protein
MPNKGFFWNETILKDLVVMGKEDFRVKYPQVSAHAYRLRLAEERKKLGEEPNAMIQVRHDIAPVKPVPLKYLKRIGKAPSDKRGELVVAAGDFQFPFEDDDVFAFKDINPAAPVHVLVIPKKYIVNMYDVGEDDALLMGKLVIATAKIAREQTAHQ